MNTLSPEHTAALVAVAFAAGAGVKHLVPPIPNRFIPLITFAVVLVGGLWGTGWDTSFDNVLDLVVKAFGPTGLHQLSKTTTNTNI